MRFGAVIVAAGMSTRMGSFKQLMTIDGVSFAERVVSTFQEAGVTDIVMVTGNRAAEVERALAGKGIEFVRNENYAHSQMFDSAKLGLERLQDRCDKILFCPVDTPLFLESTVRRLMGRPEAIVFPMYNETPGHPVMLDSAIVPAILHYDGPCGLKGALDSLAHHGVGYVPVADEGVALDADTYNEFQRLVKLQDSRAPHSKVSA